MYGLNNSTDPFCLTAHYCISLPSPPVSKCFPLAKVITTNISVKGMARQLGEMWKFYINGISFCGLCMNLWSTQEAGISMVTMIKREIN
jgi:hypothetical protein